MRKSFRSRLRLIPFVSVALLGSAIGALLRAGTSSLPRPPARVENLAARPACLRMVPALRDHDLLRSLPFPDEETALAYLRENAPLLETIRKGVQAGVGTRIADMVRCLSFDTQPHPFTRLEIEWGLRITSQEIQAADFRLRSTRGSDRSVWLPCFTRSFARPITISPPPSGLQRALVYNGRAPWVLLHDI
jgi:hypothetical protein